MNREGSKPALVVGAEGMIGEALMRHLARAGTPVMGTTRHRARVSATALILDLESDVTAWRPEPRPDVAYLCAAVTSLERCRVDPVRSRRINVDNTAVVAGSLVSAGSFVVFPSTNLVFDGARPLRRAGDEMCPLTEYGGQKAEAEQRLLALGEAVVIVRLTKVLAATSPLIEGWVRALRRQQTIRALVDMPMAPLPLEFVVQVLHRVAQARLPGILQVSGAEDITYHEFARRLAQRLGVSPSLVQGMTAAEAGLGAEGIPRYTALDVTRLREELGLEPPSPAEVIDQLVQGQ